MKLKKGLINVSGIKTTEQAKQLKDHLSKMIASIVWISITK